MASIGLAIARGNEIYDTEVKRREELDRYMAGRNLFDITLANQEAEAGMALSETQSLEKKYNDTKALHDGISKGDPMSFQMFSDEQGLGYEYDPDTNDWYHNGTNVGKLSSSSMSAIAGQYLTKNTDRFKAAQASQTDHANKMLEHNMNVALKQMDYENAANVAAITANGRVRAAAAGGSNTTQPKLSIEELTLLREEARIAMLENTFPSGYEETEDGIIFIDSEGKEQKATSNQLKGLEVGATTLVDSLVKGGYANSYSQGSSNVTSGAALFGTPIMNNTVLRLDSRDGANAITKQAYSLAELAQQKAALLAGSTYSSEENFPILDSAFSSTIGDDTSSGFGMLLP